MLGHHQRKMEQNLSKLLHLNQSTNEKLLYKHETKGNEWAVFERFSSITNKPKSDAINANVWTIISRETNNI